MGTRILGSDMPSMYRSCSAAARKILENPDLVNAEDYGGLVGVLTEIDLIVLAMREDGWGREDMSAAGHEANQVMGHLFYKTAAVVRFGPVNHPDLDDPDYLRADGKIIYARADGPHQVTSIKTPNGTFHRLLAENDPITRQGRRPGTNRTDLESWADQNIFESAKTPTAEETEAERLRARIGQLERELADARRGLNGYTLPAQARR